MAILDVIECFDETGEVIVARVPMEGSGEFRLGSQLIVQESQVAIFCRDGQFLDGFKPGRYTLATQNLPFLTKVLALPFGGKSPFRCYVYFVATKTFINIGWGTSTPVVFRDTDFRMITLRAHGAYSLRIAKPRTFLTTLVGTRGLETTFALEEFFRTLIVARLNETLGASLKSILDLPVQYSQVAQTLKKGVTAEFEQYGIQVVDLLLEAITPPPEVQAMINRASGIAAQDVDKYRTVSAADAMLEAAKTPGSASEGMGAGMGLGMGMAMAQQLAKGIAGAPAGSPPAASGDGPGVPAPKVSPAEIKAKLQELKGLKDEGLITEADFEEQKKRILSQL